MCSKNKGADQLHRYYEADLGLCFCIYTKSRFSMMWRNYDKTCLRVSDRSDTNQAFQPHHIARDLKVQI